MEEAVSPSVVYCCLFISVVCCLLFSTVESDLASDRAALETFREAVGSASLDWDFNDSPCNWKGVTCSGERVTELRVPGKGLVGEMPVGVFANLTALRTISLRVNALSGSLPSDVGSLVNLRYLYLQSNRFSGELPAEISQMVNLVKLVLYDNGFEGAIPVGLGNLGRLNTLYLQNNRFSGEIPDLDLSLVVRFNVSFNANLSGSVPTWLQSQPRDAFLGTSLCGGTLDPCSAPPAPAPPPSTENVPAGNSNLSTGAIIGIVLGCVFGTLILLALIFFLCCRNRPAGTAATGRQRQPNDPQAVEEHRPPSSAVPQPVTATSSSSGGFVPSTKKKLKFFREATNRRVFDLEDLLRASAEVLGKGTLGTTYKAMLESGTIVAVKRLKDADMNERQFVEKISLIGAMDHQCLLPLQAYYYSKDEKLVVNDFQPAGSLCGALYSGTFLNWESRRKMAKSVARGLEYIHSTHPSASHGNVKASNIIISDSNEALLSEHGLNTLLGPDALPSRLPGYRAPEVVDARKVSQKSDVYSFGVLLMELICGKMPTQALANDEGIDLPQCIKSMSKDQRTMEALDLELCKYDFNYKSEMLEMLDLAIECTSLGPNNRPTMSQVVERIPENHHGDDQSRD